MNDLSSDFLYARPSFLEGMARALDLGNTLQEYNYSLSPEQADELALRTDMRAIANDMWGAITAFLEQHPELADNESAQASARQLNLFDDVGA